MSGFYFMTKETICYVVIDANILIKDFWFKSESFSYLRTHFFLEHRPIVPEVAFLEAQNHLKKRAEELLNHHRDDGHRSAGNIRRLLRLFNYEEYCSTLALDVERLLERWESNLKEILYKYNGSILPNPDLDVSKLIQRSIDRQKPFSKGDSGFRDTIIWLTTLSLIGPNARVSFITNNTKDFFVPNSAEPHPQIVAESERLLEKYHKLLLHRSIDEFIFNFDSDRVASAGALKRALISNSLSDFDLWKWLNENLAEIIGDIEYDGIAWAGIPYYAESPCLESVDELIAVDVSDVDYHKDEVYRFYCDISFIGVLVSELLFENVESVVNENQLIWKDESDPDWTRFGIRVAATFLVRIDFNSKSQKVQEAFAHPLTHWENYDDAVNELDSTYEESKS